MSDYFPADIWREILLKLPVESLIRFTTVCKSWKSLIISREFIYAHLSHSALRRYDEHDKDDHYLPLKLTKVGSDGNKHFRFRIYHIMILSNPEIPFNSRYVHYRIVGSCDGIVCFTDYCFLGSWSYQPVTLWNPSVRNHVFLPQPITNPKSYSSYMIVLGFGATNHVYKVIRLVYPDYKVLCVPLQVEIFTLGTEMWRSISGFDIKLWVFNNARRQVLLKGIIHWLGCETIGYRSYRISILTFDIGNEVFGEVMLPDVLALTSNVATDLSLYKIGGSLALVNPGPSSFTDVCHVWVMKEYGVKESWTRLYRIDLDEDCAQGRCFQIVGFKNGEALLEYGPNRRWRDLVSYNLETKQAKNLGISGIPRSFYIDDYVESLLLLKGNSVPNVGNWRMIEGLSLGGSF